MNIFLKRLFGYMLGILLFLEILTRVAIDPVYFYLTDTFNQHDKSANKLSRIRYAFSSSIDTESVDYLFLGSSRVPATINPQKFVENTAEKAVVAGRGYAVFGVHYQGIKNRIKINPDYLKGTKVIVELAASTVYAEDSTEMIMKVHEATLESEKNMPHLMIPHLSFEDLIDYLKYSTNSFSVKTEMLLLYSSAFYRSIPFVRENLSNFDKPLFIKKKEEALTEDGGIRNDNINQVIAKAKELYKREALTKVQPLTLNQLDQSALNALHQLVHENGGKLYLYRVPIHSLQKERNATPSHQANAKVFTAWLKSKDIQTLHVYDFQYEDSDFPDIWHLSKSRRDEFTLKLREVMMKY